MNKNKELIQVLEDLLKANSESTKPTIYVNAYQNALVDIINYMNLGNEFQNKEELFRD